MGPAPHPASRPPASSGVLFGATCVEGLCERFRTAGFMLSLSAFQMADIFVLAKCLLSSGGRERVIVNIVLWFCVRVSPRSAPKGPSTSRPPSPSFPGPEPQSVQGATAKGGGERELRWMCEPRALLSVAAVAEVGAACPTFPDDLWSGHYFRVFLK